MSANNFFHVTRILRGCGVLVNIGEEVKGFGARKVMIVTDAFLYTTTYFDMIVTSLEQSGITWIVYKEVLPNPRAEDCDAAAEIARQEKIELIIGFGGGSAMDQAKAIAALITNGKTCKEWDNVPLIYPMLPTICVPTTSGTGSEVTCVAVISDTQRRYKMSIFDPIHLVPLLAVCDPLITLQLPENLTASCGIDALTHAIEAYTSRVAQPITDALALHAIRLISKNILPVIQNGNDVKAREAMMDASTMAGIAFINSNVGAVHAIAETIGAWFDTPHGVANSLFLPYLMKFNMQAKPERYADIAAALGVSLGCQASNEEMALAGIEFIKSLIKTLKIPTLSQLQEISPDIFEIIAQRSADNILSKDNARPISKADYLSILYDAYQA